ncbi:hypothetical protein [Flavobacterium sp.]|uniref:hypothetical protein n=1 Tax=Flavobacterium sp. TaxID=239 RepID=UPI003C3915E9
MTKNYFSVLMTLFLLIISYTVNAQGKESIIEVKYVRNNDNSVTFSYIKNAPGTYRLNIKFNNLSNTYANDYEELVKYDSGQLLTLKPDKSDSYINFGYSTSYMFGNFEPKVDSLFQYVLPFKKGKSIKIYESSNLNEKYFGAEKSKSWKSYYVTSKTPDTVYAMRKGIVVNIKNEYKTDTLVTGYIYSSKRNGITIEHSDGTYSSYTGLKQNSILVQLGETVFPTTPLGVLDIFNNKTYNLHFNIYYIGNKNYVHNPDATIKTAKTPYAYLTPYFYTTEGLTKITAKNSFTPDYTEVVLNKEMTKKEVKQRMKKNNLTK